MKKSIYAIKQKALSRNKHFLKLKNHPFLVPVSTFLVMMILTAGLLVATNGQTVASSDSHIVKLSINGKQKVIPTRAKTVGELLQRANVVMNEGDVVEPAKDTPIVDDDFRVNLYRARPVTVYDGEKRIQALSAATTPRSVAIQVGLTVYPEDYINVVSNDASLKDNIIGQKIAIDRASLAYINLYGTPLTVRTHAKTVGELIKEKGIKLAGDDTLRPDSAVLLTPTTQVFIIGNGIKVVALEEDIPMPEEIIDDPNLSFGTSAIRQNGSAGKRTSTYQIEVQKGVEISRKLLQTVVTVEPVKQIVARGKAIYIPEDKSVWMSAAGIEPGDYPYVNYIISHESGWCPSKWQGQIGYCPAFYTQLHDPSSGYGFGLCQSTPAIKMASAGADWSTSPITQLRWCSGYAKARYGSWGAAYNHWLSSRNW